jgi:hypothetical protein
MLDTFIGVAPDHHTRIWDGIARWPDICTFNYAYHLLYYDSWPSHPRLQRQPSSIQQNRLDMQQSFQILYWAWPQKIWPRRDHGTSTMRMWVFLKVTMAQAWGCPDTAPEYRSRWPCSKSGVGANQHNLNILQHSIYANNTTHSWQAYS